MSFMLAQLEEMVEWCSTCPDLAAARGSGWRTFSGGDGPRPVRYWPGLGDLMSRQRRFLGWFMFSFTLPGGSHPAQLAAEALYRDAERSEALTAVAGARYASAIVTSVVPGRGLFLEDEGESLEVRSRTLTQFFVRGMTLVSYLVPSRPGLWLPGPGWFQCPTPIIPKMGREIGKAQPDSVSVERLLQTYPDRPGNARKTAYPEDATLVQAVARMNRAASTAGRTGLIMSDEEWRSLAAKHLDNSDFTAFTHELIGRVGGVDGVEELNRWLALAMNIWNNIPR